ncbi:hypothetical protein JCM15457_681 [Liquorilactobacillus sucicola DSM 21376 = JCM 15457]|uniref:Uncharacterized protein n=1 Tax=Liquorilactobacillus sucicola DSM 21376 = JCM 15457 TaxID=1423806 RepID=A0A023CVB9_9LACO|nr:hypothetical protein [Liquorilactobacillus sucicola]KRN05713.1 hypothetical protein FD15_GL002279 [Liquorilactobacillus sucicola DSM 21376 = JCM 15457]GAJ25802.1 hypothetical protein JCM15457_681 [Liquorilactobacillus sucicola DSM 21376 = JCM 15457]
MSSYELVARIQHFELFSNADKHEILKKDTLSQEKREYRLKPTDFISFLSEVDLYNNSHQNTAKFIKHIEDYYLNIGNRIVR